MDAVRPCSSSVNALSGATEVVAIVLEDNHAAKDHKGKGCEVE